MAQKNRESIEKNMQTYEAYFKEDLDAIEEELKKSKEYSEIIDGEIQKLAEPGLGLNKGGQHYLIEHITNAVSLQTQRQGLRRDRVAIKKAIVEYAAKFAEENGTDESALVETINRLLEKDKIDKSKIATNASDESLDSEVDKILENGES